MGCGPCADQFSVKGEDPGAQHILLFHDRAYRVSKQFGAFRKNSDPAGVGQLLCEKGPLAQEDLRHGSSFPMNEVPGKHQRKYENGKCLGKENSGRE